MSRRLWRRSPTRRLTLVGLRDGATASEWVIWEIDDGIDELELAGLKVA